MKNTIAALILTLMTLTSSSFANSTLEEAQSFLLSLKPEQHLNGSIGCEDVRISSATHGEVNFYLSVGEQNFQILNPYTLKSTTIDGDTFIFDHTIRGGSLFSQYPLTYIKMKIEKDKKGNIETLVYSFQEKSSPIRVSHAFRISCSLK